MDKAAKFQQLQLRCQKADAALYDQRRYMEEHKHSRRYSHFTQYQKEQALEERAARAFAALTRFLAAHSPRNWQTHVPCSYIRDRLTFEDVTTAGQLTTIPPPAYGYTPGELARFAQPVR